MLVVDISALRKPRELLCDATGFIPLRGFLLQLPFELEQPPLHDPLHILFHAREQLRYGRPEEDLVSDGNSQRRQGFRSLVSRHGPFAFIPEQSSNLVLAEACFYAVRAEVVFNASLIRLC